MLKATFIGAASDVETFGFCSGAESLFSSAGNFVAKATFQAVNHGTFQAAMTAISGGKFWSGFAAGAMSSIASSTWGVGNNSQWQGLGGKLADKGAGIIAFGTVAGGAGAALTGGNFWQGAITGLVVSGLNHAMHQMDSFGSEGKDPKLPEVQKFKNGVKIKGADGKVYQVHNSEWVKLDGVLIDVSSANLGYGSNENAINMPHEPLMVDRAIHRANLKLHFNNVVNGKSIASSAFLEYLVKGNLPKYNFWSTVALGTYNFFDGMYNQYNLNLQHDKTAALFSK